MVWSFRLLERCLVVLETDLLPTGAFEAGGFLGVSGLLGTAGTWADGGAGAGKS